MPPLFPCVKASSTDQPEGIGSDDTLGTITQIIYYQERTGVYRAAAPDTLVPIGDSVVLRIDINFKNYITGTINFDYVNDNDSDSLSFNMANPNSTPTQTDILTGQNNQFTYQITAENCIIGSIQKITPSTNGYGRVHLRFTISFVSQRHITFYVYAQAANATTRLYASNGVPMPVYIYENTSSLSLSSYGDFEHKVITHIDNIHYDLVDTNDKLDDILDAINTQTQVITTGFDTIHDDINQRYEDYIETPFQTELINIGNLTIDQRTNEQKTIDGSYLNRITQMNNNLLGVIFQQGSVIDLILIFVILIVVVMAFLR